MAFKPLHQFTIMLDKEIEETSTRVENGAEITTKAKVTKSVPHIIVLKEPTRKEKQALSLFSSQAHNNAVNMGLLTKLAMIQKISKSMGDPLSSDADTNLAAMNSRLQELANDYIRYNTQPDQTDEIKERKARLSTEYMALSKKVADLETAYQSVFANTAEQYQQNQVLTWLALFLTFVQVNGKPEPMFVGATFEVKEDRLGDLEDAQDKLYLAAVQKVSTCWMLFYFGQAASASDFEIWEQRWLKEIDASKKVSEDSSKPLAVAESLDAPVVEKV